MIYTLISIHMWIKVASTVIDVGQYSAVDCFPIISWAATPCVKGGRACINLLQSPFSI